MPLESAGLAALVLIARRYAGGEPLLVASPASAQGSALSFFTDGGLDEDAPCAAFLDRVHAGLAHAARQAPCVLAEIAAGLGLDAGEEERAFLQIAYAFGPAADSADLRARAGVLVRLERRGQDVVIEVSAKGTALAAVLVPPLARHIARALVWLADHDRAPLRTFELLSEAERRQIARGFNDTRVVGPDGLTLPGLIEAQAARTPAATAVVHGDRELSYRTLDRQANHLAAILTRDYRVPTGACVGVMMARSEQTIVAILGVMKAGAAYVPINPRLPWDTVRYMLENAGIAVLIVDSESIAAAARFAGDIVVADIELRGSPEAAPPAAPAAAGDLAYVIYTSGSTGRPKGVAIEHRAIVNTILWRNAFYGIGPTDVNLQLPSLAFDSSVVDIFCVLAAGGTLVVPDEAMRLDARRLLALSVARGVTSCIATPSYYRVLLSELADAPASLRWVTLAGETATPDIVAAHLRALPGVALYNEYGPTEHAVCATACRIDAVEATVPIGRPIWNDVVAIVDTERRLVPIGVPGEIHLGGAGLARGYLNQDRLTAERFGPSPAPDVCAGPMYRTGDRGCWRPDGSLEFLGRLDSQVKIRGFRIELDEIEHALRRHPGVRNVAVIRKGGANDGAYLAAYVEPHGEVTRHELRAHLAVQLPYYMMPDAFAVMPELPLNLNGKIDRATLADVDDFPADADAAVPVLSPVQASLAVLWADILKRQKVALDDDFFAIGGNSLRVMELTSRIRGEMALSVELRDIYTYPTVRGLADRLDRPTPS